MYKKFFYKYGGVFSGGVFLGGIFRGGIHRGGIWLQGIFRGGVLLVAGATIKCLKSVTLQIFCIANMFYFKCVTFQVQKVLHMQIYKIPPPVLLFPFVLHQLLHHQIIFTNLQNFIQNYLEKDFRNEFSFSNGFTQTPTPSTVEAVVRRCSLKTCSQKSRKIHRKTPVNTCARVSFLIKLQA